MSGIHFNTYSPNGDLYQNIENTNTEKGSKRNIESVQPSANIEITSLMSRDSTAKRIKTEKDGDYYFALYVSTPDAEKTFASLKKAADLGHPEAQYNLGIHHYENNNDPQELSKAIYYFDQSAKQNFVPAKVILGFIYQTELDEEVNADEIIRLWTEAAEADDMNAQLYLGILYRKGELIPQDFDKARMLFIKAAEKGSPEADYQLGLLHLENPQSEDSNFIALNCFLSAASKGCVIASYKLGIMYEGGIGTDMNIEKALIFYQKAADHNYDAALHRLGDIYVYGRHNVLPSVIKGLGYFKKAAKNGYVDSQLELGVLYKDARKFEAAIHFLTAAAEQNSAEAQFELGQIYEMAGSYHHISKAYFWFGRAAQNDHEAAFQKLAPKKAPYPRPSRTV